MYFHIRVQAVFIISLLNLSIQMLAQYLYYSHTLTHANIHTKPFSPKLRVKKCVVNIFILNPEICNQKTNFPSGIRDEHWTPSPNDQDQMNEIIILNKSDLFGSVVRPFFIPSLFSISKGDCLPRLFYSTHSISRFVKIILMVRSTEI